MLMHEPGNLLGVWYRSSNASDHEELVVLFIILELYFFQKKYASGFLLLCEQKETSSIFPVNNT